MRESIIKKVLEKKIIAIVRGVYGADCLKLAQALYEGGVEMMRSPSTKALRKPSTAPPIPLHCLWRILQAKW